MSSTYNIVYSQEAINDIRKIYTYIAYKLQVLYIASNQINRIKKEIHSLSDMPMRYTIVDWEPWKSMHMHKLPVNDYNIFYIANTNTMTVTIIRIVYCGQDIENIINVDL